jgi:hypothetical protein
VPATKVQWLVISDHSQEHFPFIGHSVEVPGTKAGHFDRINKLNFYETVEHDVGPE